MKAGTITSNLISRLRLMRTALSRRFIYNDIVQMARAYGIEYRDVVGNIEPFEFVEAVLNIKDGAHPDFGWLQKQKALFNITGLPLEAVSEPSVARFIGKLVFHLDARTVVELGTFSGWTSAHISLALLSRENGGRLYCVEMHDRHIDASRLNLARYELDQGVEIIRGMSMDKYVLERLPNSIDLVFLDTSHSYPGTRDEMNLYLPLLSARGCLVLHDSVAAPGVRRSLIEVPKGFRQMSFATEDGNGVTILAQPTLFEVR